MFLTGDAHRLVVGVGYFITTRSLLLVRLFVLFDCRRSRCFFVTRDGQRAVNQLAMHVLRFHASDLHVNEIMRVRFFDIDSRTPNISILQRTIYMVRFFPHEINCRANRKIKNNCRALTSETQMISSCGQCRELRKAQESLSSAHDNIHTTARRLIQPQRLRRDVHNSPQSTNGSCSISFFSDERFVVNGEIEKNEYGRRVIEVFKLDVP